MKSRKLLPVVVILGCQNSQPKEPSLGTPPKVGSEIAQITITNECLMDVWVESSANAGSPDLPDGIVKLAANTGSHAYTMPSTGWAGRFWTKTQCNDKGQECATGQALPPCPSTGCQPPADTKIEFFFGPNGGTDRPYYDVSLVDGYSLGVKIVPSTSGGRCTPTQCDLDLSACPMDEKDNVGISESQMEKETFSNVSPHVKSGHGPHHLEMGKQKRIPQARLCVVPVR